MPRDELKGTHPTVTHQHEEVAKVWTRAQYQVAMHAVEDDTFKRRLLQNPLDVLAEYGISVASGVKIKVIENTGDTVHLAFPPDAKHLRIDIKDTDLESGSGPSIKKWIDDFDIRGKIDPRGAGQGGPGTTDNDYRGDPHTADHQS